MKLLLILLFSILSAGLLRAQIINGGFEEWRGDTLVGWNYIGNLNENPSGKSSNSHFGNFCFRWEKYLIHAGNPVSFEVLSNSPGFRVPIGKYTVSYWVRSSINGNTNSAYFVSSWGRFTNGGVKVLSSYPFTSNSNWTKQSGGNIYSSDSLSTDSVVISFGGWYDSGEQAHDFILELDDFSFEPIGSSVQTNNSFTHSPSISPNPISSHAHLNLHLENPASIHSALYDITGRKVLDLPSLESASGDESIPFDVDEIPNGMYYLRCEIGGNMNTEKIIVNH